MTRAKKQGHIPVNTLFNKWTIYTNIKKNENYPNICQLDMHNQTKNINCQAENFF